MADAEVSFALNLEGNLGQAAGDDAAALTDLRNAIVSDTESLRAMQRAYSSLKSSTTANSETVKQLKNRIDASKAAIAAKNEKLVGMKGAFEKIPKPAAASTGALQQLAVKADTADGPVAQLLKRLGGMKSILGAGAIAAGVVALAAALGTLTIATFAAVGALTLYAIKQADARRSDLLRLEGLSKHRNYWLEMVTGQRRAANSAEFLQSTIDRVAAASPLARDRIGELTGELYKAGLRSGTLQQGLEALAIVEATQGQEAAAAFKARMLGAQLYGTSIKKLSDDVKNRLGGIAKAQMLSLDVQQRKLKENIAQLFSGIKITPFLEGLSKVAELFSQSTATGRALKAIVEALLQPLINQAGAGAPLVKRFFQGMIIAALQLTIVVLRVRNALRDALGGSELLKKVDLTTLAIKAGMFAFTTFATAVVLTTAAVGAFVAGVVTAGVVIYNIVEPWVSAVGAMIGAGVRLLNWVFSFSWQELGGFMVRGIVAGLAGGANLVANAMMSLGDTAIKAFKKRLGIASPSKAAEAEGMQFPRGVVRAQERGRAMVSASTERLGAAMQLGLARGAGAPAGERAAAPVMPRTAQAPAAARGGAGAPSIVLQIAQGAVQIQGGGANAKQLEAQLQDAVEELFERAANMLGAQLAEASA